MTPYAIAARQGILDRAQTLAGKGARDLDRKSFWSLAVQIGETAHILDDPEKLLEEVRQIAISQGVTMARIRGPLQKGYAKGLSQPRQISTPWANADEVRELIGQWLEVALASNAEDTSRIALTRRALIESIAKHAIAKGCTKVDVSVREAAASAGLTKNTVSAHAHELGPWITYEASHSKMGTRSTWELHLDETSLVQSDRTPKGENLIGLYQRDCALDSVANSRWLYAKGQREAWLTLGTSKFTPKDLAIETGRHVVTIRKWLREWEAEGLARQIEPGLWTAAIPAEVLGNDEALARRVTGYATESALYEDYRTRRDQIDEAPEDECGVSAYLESLEMPWK